MKRPPRNRKSKPGHATDTLQYVAGGLLLLVSVVAIFTIGWYYVNAPKRISLAANGCPSDGPTGFHEVIIDSTDLLPEPAQQQVATKIIALARSLGKSPGELLELRTIDVAKPAGNVLFSRCSPGEGTQISDMTGNSAKAKKRWNDEFLSPIEILTAGGYSTVEADHSPLLETFQALGVELLEPFGQTGHPIDLIIISDMRQHSDAYSQYTGDLTYARYHASPAYRKLHTNLGSASLTILYVQRNHPKIDESAHIGFWNEWATDNGASLVSVERLQGEN